MPATIGLAEPANAMQTPRLSQRGFYTKIRRGADLKNMRQNWRHDHTHTLAQQVSHEHGTGSKC